MQIEEKATERVSMCMRQIQLYVPRTLKDIARARKLLDMLEEEINEEVDIEDGKVFRLVRLDETSPRDSLKSQPVSSLSDPTPKPENPLKEESTAKLSDNSAPFIFAECEPFKWFSLPTFRRGKTMYHLSGEKVHILREGYGDCAVWANTADLKILYGQPDELMKKALSNLHENKKYILKGFLYDVEFSNIGLRDKNQTVSAPEPNHSSIIPVETSKASAGEQSSSGTKTSKTQEITSCAKIEPIPNFFIPKFEWDKTKEKNYRTIFFYEHEDGNRVMIFYLYSRIFTTKEAVMTLPYPVPYNCAPLRAIQNNKRTALKFYREYLAKEALSNEIVRKTAEVNEHRWKEKVETEMSPRTKELREKFGIPGLVIRDKGKQTDIINKE